MKKTLIAAAVAAVVAAPVAMAEVSISGSLQAEITSIGGDGAGTNNKGLYVADGGCGLNVDSCNQGALNFAASEDLGDGMKALAKYSFNTHTDASTGVREAYVGLSGGFGTVLAGRMNHPYKTSTIGYDPFLSTGLQARNNGGMANGLYGGEISNALAYANTFGSVKVVAALVVDENAKAASTTETNGKNVMSFSVVAPVGPVELALAYANASEYGRSEDFVGGTSTTAFGKDAIATKLGAKWVSGDITVAGQYEMLDKGLTAGEKSNVMYVTGSYAMGNNVVSAAYGKTDKKVTGGTDDTVYMAIGLNHKFSKNTNTYVGYRSTDAGTGAKETAVSAGLRVNF